MSEISQPKRRIAFEFNLDKFVNMVAYFTEKCQDADRLKLCKLIYYADKLCLVRNGHPIIGGWYVKMQMGPVPSEAYDILKGGIDSKKFDEAISVDRNDRCAYYTSKKSCDRSVFSKAEMIAIEETIEKYGKYSGMELKEMVSKEVAYKETDLGQEIDYRLFFKENPDVKEGMQEYMEMSQEERDWLKQFDD